MEKVKLGIIGCGDVTTNLVLPGLRNVAGIATVAAVCDLREDVARQAARQCADFSPDAAVYTDRRLFLEHPGLDGVLQLLPAPLHGEVNREVLEAGLNLYSEKPLAASIEEADELIELAEKAGRHFLCAPGVVVMPGWRWVDEILRSGRLGAPTVAVAQFGSLGGAGWRRYTGDPAIFYTDAVGPVLDLGVYPLHALTGFFGPVARVQAMGAIRIPERISVAKGSAGRRIEVTADDVVMAQLEFANGMLGHVFASYASPASQVPHLEVHCSGGTISVPIMYMTPAIDIFTVDPTPAGADGWMRGLQPPDAAPGTVHHFGVMHFARVLAGLEEPRMSPEHARHVLDVMQTIVRAARAGGSHEPRTTFARAGAALAGT